MRTKWDVLSARLDEARNLVMSLEDQLHGLENTECGLRCHGCGTFLTTEADFAKHFVIPDERFLNLGNCPNTDK